MESHEMDKLMSDIQDYLKEGEPQGKTDRAVASAPAEKRGLEFSPGTFIGEGFRRKIPAVIMLSKVASCLVQICTIALFTLILLNPLQSAPKTAMLLLGVLIFGVFAITSIMSFQTRIELLLKIEDNTRSIAASKARIAETLEGIHLE